MKKLVYGRKMSRNYGARKGLKYALIRSFILSGKIKTTLIKAKFVQKDIEKLISFSIKNKGNCYRVILSKVRNDKELTQRIVDIGKNYQGSRTCGFIKRTSLSARKGDNAQMAFIEWNENMGGSKVEEKKANKKDKTGKEDKKIKKVKKIDLKKNNKKPVKALK